MTNPRLQIDYVRRAGHRLAALQVLLERESYADVIREAQETVELSLKALDDARWVHGRVASVVEPTASGKPTA